MRKSFCCCQSVLNMVATNVTINIIDCFGQNGTSLNDNNRRLEETIQINVQRHSSYVIISFLFYIFFSNLQSKVKAMFAVFHCTAYLSVGNQTILFTSTLQFSARFYQTHASLKSLCLSNNKYDCIHILYENSYIKWNNHYITTILLTLLNH